MLLLIKILYGTGYLFFPIQLTHNPTLTHNFMNFLSERSLERTNWWSPLYYIVHTLLWTKNTDKQSWHKSNAFIINLEAPHCSRCGVSYKQYKNVNILCLPSVRHSTTTFTTPNHRTSEKRRPCRKNIHTHTSQLVAGGGKKKDSTHIPCLVVADLKMATTMLGEN